MVQQCQIAQQTCCRFRDAIKQCVFFAVYAVTGIIGVGENIDELIDSYQTWQIHVR